MGKRNQADDEIPLRPTHTGSHITNETKARFDTLLRAALDQEQESSKFRHKKKDNVENTKLPKSAVKWNTDETKSEIQYGNKNCVDGEINTFQSADVLNNETNSPSSTDDDDVVIKEKLSSDFLKNNKKNSQNSGNASGKKAEELVLNKMLKDERNSNQISQQKESVYRKSKTVLEKNEVDESKINNNGKHTMKNNKLIESVQDITDYSESLSHSSPVKNGEQLQLTVRKKPVPLPRIKTGKKAAEFCAYSEKESDNSHQNTVPASTSLNPLLPLDSEVPTNTDTDDDNDCILPQKVIKNILHTSDKKHEEIELKEMKAISAIEAEKKEIASKKSFHKTRRKSRGVEVDVETAMVTESTQPSQCGYDKIVGIFIHRSDCLQIDPLVQHPLVKIYLIDASTGNYLKKSSMHRSVSFYYENKEVDYIQPLMTEVFNYRERRSVMPLWDELVVFNEDFEYILRNDPPVLILFEILDFVSFAVASSQYRRLGSEGGWHQVAWAFLKPVGANGLLNVEKQVRLQLYKPQQTQKSDCNSCDVYRWWSGGIWERYPATLYVTVKGITPPEHLPPVLRSRSALQGELCQSPDFLDMDQKQDQGDAKSDNENSLASAQLLTSAGTSLPEWSRLPSQSCKIPNHRKLALPTASRGCFNVKFSNSGLYLACSIAGEEKFFITVYSIPDGKEIVRFVGHQGLVYDLHWSSKDTMLLSASADCTACLWDTESWKSRPMQMLPHPSFVYCAQFHPCSSTILVTGCCDHVVRVWNRPHKSSHYELIQELEGHTGFVSALTVNSNGMIYSSDSMGSILEWTGVKGKSKKQYSQWKLNRNIDIRELRNTVMNRLHVHPGGQRLLVHARDSCLRMLDLATSSIIQWFNGALNHRVQTSACLSPCGGSVYAASEDGTVHVWNADTGEQLAMYSGLQFSKATSGIDYHPFEHMAAFASYGSPALVVVCDYDKLASGKDLGLQLLFHQDHTKQFTQSATESVNESYMKNSKSLSFFNSSLKKKKRRAMPVSYVSEMEVSQQDSNLISKSIVIPAEGSVSSLSPSSANVASPWKEDDSECSKVKLASIIEKMDEVLSRTPSKSSQQLSDSMGHRNFEAKLSDSSVSKSESFHRSTFKKKRKQKEYLLPM